MELININRIYYTVLDIYIFIGIMIYLRPTFKYIYLIILSNKNDFQKYLKTVDRYIKKAKKDREKNFYINEKIKAMIKFRKWNEIEDVINSIHYLDLTSSKSFADLFSNTILNLYILDRINEGRLLLSKIENKNDMARRNYGIKLCVVINDYFNNDLMESKKGLQGLLNIKINRNKATLYQKYYIGNIYFYLGLICIRENEIMKSKEYFKSALETIYPRKCAFGDIVWKTIDEFANYYDTQEEALKHNEINAKSIETFVETFWVNDLHPAIFYASTSEEFCETMLDEKDIFGTNGWRCSYLKSIHIKEINSNEFVPVKEGSENFSDDRLIVLYGITKSSKANTIKVEGQAPTLKTFEIQGENYTLWYTMIKLDEQDVDKVKITLD